MIFTGKRVFKVGRTEYCSNISFYTHDVTGWEEYVYPDYKKYPGAKVYVYTNDKSSVIIRMSFKQFDAMMKKDGVKIGLK